MTVTRSRFSNLWFVHGVGEKSSASFSPIARLLKWTGIWAAKKGVTTMNNNENNETTPKKDLGNSIRAVRKRAFEIFSENEDSGVDVNLGLEGNKITALVATTEREEIAMIWNEQNKNGEWEQRELLIKEMTGASIQDFFRTHL